MSLFTVLDALYFFIADLLDLFLWFFYTLPVGVFY